MRTGAFLPYRYSRCLKAILARTAMEVAARRLPLSGATTQKAGHLPSPPRRMRLIVTKITNRLLSPFLFANPIFKPFTRFSEYQTLKMFSELISRTRLFSPDSSRRR
jgi:hypothetical protein